jgi:hypothetical protein
VHYQVSKLDPDIVLHSFAQILDELIIVADVVKIKVQLQASMCAKW